MSELIQKHKIQWNIRECAPIPAFLFYSWPVYEGFILNCAEDLPVCSILQARQSLGLVNI